MNGFDVALFRDFGFPALLVGVLLWVYFSRLEKLVTTVTELRHKIDELIREVERLEDEIRGRTPRERNRD